MEHVMPDIKFSLFDRYAKPKPAPAQSRPPWRPKTRTPDHYAALLANHQSIGVWFLETFGRPHKSDSELLKAHFAHEFQKLGLRASRADDAQTAKKLKTLVNELSTARRLFPNSRKGALKGSG
jgi:hypothetical protein